VLRIYVDHYNRERPHRALKLCPPEPERDASSCGSKINRRERPHRALKLCPPEPERDASSCGSKINRRDRLGGLIHEYHRAAA